MGVVNARAINLVQPEFPKSAISVNVYGEVLVQVLIDETGRVVSAKPISGNLLLFSSSVNAAMKSGFEPVFISSKAVCVSGIITYNFIPREWNWLEIGFALKNYGFGYYTTANLPAVLPAGFEQEKQLLQEFLNTPENQSITTIIALISGKLSGTEKAEWLFSLGLALGEMKQNLNCPNKKIQDSIEKIRILLQSKPANASAFLVLNLEKLTLEAENPDFNACNTTEGTQIYKLLKEFEQKFPFI